MIFKYYSLPFVERFVKIKPRVKNIITQKGVGKFLLEINLPFSYRDRAAQKQSKIGYRDRGDHKQSKIGYRDRVDHKQSKIGYRGRVDHKQSKISYRSCCSETIKN